MSAPVIFLFFIGSFAVLSVLGLLAMWVDRKVTARLQFRVGPPWYQNFADFVKLTGKETLIPEDANRFIFVLAPVISVLATTLCGAILFLVFKKDFGFPGDLILLVYLLAIPALAIILAGSASGNVLASVGISREMKLLLGYELPFICAIIIPAIKSGATTSLLDILQFQRTNGLVIGSVSGVIGFLISVFSVQGKMGYVPFDLAEAEGEISSGALIEYSGILLGVFRLAKALLLVVAPLFIVTLYMGGIDFSSWTTVINGILKYILILVLIILIKNTNPRVRIDQAMRFFWGWMTLFGITGILLAIMGW